MTSSVIPLHSPYVCVQAYIKITTQGQNPKEKGGTCPEIRSFIPGQTETYVIYWMESGPESWVFYEISDTPWLRRLRLKHIRNGSIFISNAHVFAGGDHA
jgi:hypothetical protein